MTHHEKLNPQPTLPESTGNPYMDAVKASEQRLAEAHTETLADESGAARLQSSDVDIEAERYAAAVNHGRAEGWQEGSSPDIMTAEEIRTMLNRSPDVRERLDGMKDRYDASLDSAGKREASDDSVLSAEAMREIMHMPEEQARDELDDINHQSVGLLDSNPSNNTGVGDIEFAKLRFKASVYAMRLEDLHQGKPGADHEQHDRNLDAILEESKLWERVANGETVSFQESQAVRQHALDLREAYDKQPTDEPAEPEKPQGAEFLDQIPEDEKERRQFSEREFAKYDPAKMELYKAFITKEIRDWAAVVPEGAKYPDTIATLLGGGDSAAMTYFSYAILDRDRNIKSITAKDIVSLNFSKACKDYLGLDVFEAMPDYAEKFNTKVGDKEPKLRILHD